MRVEEQLAAIEARIRELAVVAEEAKRLLELLEGIEEGKEVILPIGGGLFTKFKWENSLLMDVGGGIVLELKPEEVVERLKRRVERAEAEIKRLQEERNKIIESLNRTG